MFGCVCFLIFFSFTKKRRKMLYKCLCLVLCVLIYVCFWCVWSRKRIQMKSRQQKTFSSSFSSSSSRGLFFFFFFFFFLGYTPKTVFFSLFGYTPQYLFPSPSLSLSLVCLCLCLFHSAWKRFAFSWFPPLVG